MWTSFRGFLCILESMDEHLYKRYHSLLAEILLRFKTFLTDPTFAKN